MIQKLCKFIICGQLIVSTAWSVPTPQPSPNDLPISASSLRQMILEGNNTVLTELNQIYQSKDSVNISRAKLLPSVNLGTMASGSGFSLASVSFLLPFLAPSNWFNLAQSEKLLEAEKEAYFALELNVYASALALYQQIVGDMALRDVFQENYQVLKNIADMIERENQDVGSVPSSDVLHSRAQADMAHAQVSQMDELIIQEKAQLRKSLGMEVGLNKNLWIDRTFIKASPYESYPPETVLERAQYYAPERRQIRHLIEAAEAGKWSTILAFLGGGGSTLSANAGAGQPISFSNLASNYSFTLTFATFPAVELTNDSIAQLGLRMDEVYLEQRTTIESALGSLVESKKQLLLSNQAYDRLTQLYEIEYQKYGLGLTDFLHVLTAQTTRFNAALSRVKAQMDMNSLRTGLHRVAYTDEFLNIRGCMLNRSAAKKSGGGLFDWFKEIFDPQINKTNLNEICRPIHK